MPWSSWAAGYRYIRVASNEWLKFTFTCFRWRTFKQLREIFRLTTELSSGVQASEPPGSAVHLAAEMRPWTEMKNLISK